MNILIFNHYYTPNVSGGAEISVQILAEGLNDLGHNVTVVSTNQKEYSDSSHGINRIYLNPLKFIRHGDSNPLNIFKRGVKSILEINNYSIDSKIRSILSQTHYDIVHTNTMNGFSARIWKLFREKNIPIVHTLRDHYLLCRRTGMFHNTPCKQQCFQCVITSCYKKKYSQYAGGVVGISRYILDTHLKRGYFNNAISTVIFNPVLPAETHSPNTDRNNLVCGFAGRLEKPKGIHFLLEKFSLSCYPSLTLHVYGKSNFNANDKHLKLEYESERTIFKGFVDRTELYKAVDFMIVPSLLNESFGRTIAEAVSRKIPVLASNRGGITELIIEGVNGFTFDPDKTGDFEEKLHRMKHFIINDTYEEKRFEATSIIKSYELFYRKVIDKLH